MKRGKKVHRGVKNVGESRWKGDFHAVCNANVQSDRITTDRKGRDLSPVLGSF